MDGTLFMYVAGDSESGPRKFLFERFWQILEAVDIFDQFVESLSFAWFFSGGGDLSSGVRCFLKKSQFVQSFFYLAGGVLMFSDEERLRLNEFLIDLSLPIEDLLTVESQKSDLGFNFSQELWENMTKNDYKLMGEFVAWFSFVFALFDQENLSLFQYLLDFFEEYQNKIFTRIKRKMRLRGFDYEEADAVCLEIRDFFSKKT